MTTDAEIAKKDYHHHHQRFTCGTSLTYRDPGLRWIRHASPHPIVTTARRTASAQWQAGIVVSIVKALFCFLLLFIISINYTRFNSLITI
jgi:hypothetical protein